MHNHVMSLTTNNSPPLPHIHAPLTLTGHGASEQVEDDWDEEEDSSGDGARMATSPRTSSHARGTSMTLGDVSQRARYIPLRLTFEERKDLRRVNAAINVSEYTTSVDRSFRNEVKRTRAQLQAICAFLSGIVASKGNSQCQQVHPPTTTTTTSIPSPRLVPHLQRRTPELRTARLRLHCPFPLLTLPTISPLFLPCRYCATETSRILSSFSRRYIYYL
jgi:hypothetical protein